MGNIWDQPGILKDLYKENRVADGIVYQAEIKLSKINKESKKKLEQNWIRQCIERNEKQLITSVLWQHSRCFQTKFWDQLGFFFLEYLNEWTNTITKKMNH